MDSAQVSYYSTLHEQLSKTQQFQTPSFWCFITGPCGASVTISCSCTDHRPRCFKKLDESYWQVGQARLPIEIYVLRHDT